MSDSLQNILQKAAIKILRPLIRIMLRNGVACGNFEEMVRKAYVDESFILTQQQGKATISAVSAQTGLSRKEVKRLQEITSDDTNENGQKYNRAIRVISGWLNDARFVSGDQIARPLDMEGSENSFTTLVKEYSGDIPTRAMFDLLEKSGCVEKQGDKVYLISHAYVPGNDPTDVINILGTDTHELMQSITHNMSCEKDQRYFQRKVSTQHLSALHLEDFKKYSNRRSQSLLEDLDNWLTDHEPKSDEESLYVSLGIYFYQADKNEETNS